MEVQVTSKVAQLGTLCRQLRPKLGPTDKQHGERCRRNRCGAKLGRSWIQVGPSWAEAHVAVMSDRNGALGHVGPIGKMCKLAKRGTDFCRLARPPPPPQLKLFQSDRSVRSHPLLNYHASAPSVRPVFFSKLVLSFSPVVAFFATLFLHFVLVVHLVFVFTTILQISSRSLQKIRSTPEARTPRVHDSSIRVHIAGVHLCNRFIATILGAPIFELQNHVHNPETAPTKCNGFTWLLATNKNAFCSSIIFEPFKDRNAFCSAPFGVQKYTKFITKNARHHFIALGRWLMEFLLPFQSRCAFQG